MKALITNPIRIIRMALGAAALYYAVVSQDALLGVAGGLFLLMGIFNAGCCVAGNCRVPNKGKSSRPKQETVQYEEITSK